MLTLNYKFADANIIGDENGLNIQEEFANYKSTIAKIITDLNQRKDKRKIQYETFRHFRHKTNFI